MAFSPRPPSTDKRATHPLHRARERHAGGGRDGGHCCVEKRAGRRRGCKVLVIDSRERVKIL